MEEKEKGLFQYKAFFTDGTHSYLYFYKRLDFLELSNRTTNGWLIDSTDELINLDKCKGIRLMKEPEGVTNE